MKINKCACGWDAILSEDSRIFIGQIYSGRYEEPIASQNNGYQIRCVRCGLQTYWWHFEDEAIRAWNDPKKFIEEPSNTQMQTGACKCCCPAYASLKCNSNKDGNCSAMHR